MKKNWGISFLILCFELSNLHIGLADQVVAIPPIVVQPVALNQQAKQNSQDEKQIKELIENNNELIQQDLDRQNDENLAKLDQSMLNYRQNIVSQQNKYADLIKLTEDADDTTVHHELVEKSDMLAQKYLMLEALKDEMTSLNERLENQQLREEAQEGSTLDGYKKITQEQQNKIQILVTRLSEMDQRIEHLDDMLSERDERIAQLKDSLSMAEKEIDMLKQQALELSLKGDQIKAQVYQVQGATQQAQHEDKDLDHIQSQVEELRNTIDQQARDIEAKDEVIKIQAQELQHLPNTGAVSGQDNIAIPPIYVNPSVSAQKNIATSPIYVNRTSVNPAPNTVSPSPVYSTKPQVIVRRVPEVKTVYVNRSTTVDLSPYRNRIEAQDKMLVVKDQQLSQQQAQAQTQLDSLKSQTQGQLDSLKNQLQQQDQDLKSKEDMIHWLNQAVEMNKSKAQYFKLTAQQSNLSLQAIQDQIQRIKNDFVERFRNYDQIETSLTSLRQTVYRLDDQLQEKQQQVDLLKDELERKINEQRIMAQQEVRMQAELNGQIRDRDNQIAQMKGDMLALQQQQADQKSQNQKEQDLISQLNNSHDQITQMKGDQKAQTQKEQGLASQLDESKQQVTQLKDQVKSIQQAQAGDDRLKLAQQLINLQQQETDLLDQKARLGLEQYKIFESHYNSFEQRMGSLIDQRQIEQVDMKDTINSLQNDSDLKQQEIDSLKTKIEEKIAQEANGQALQMQVEQLTSELQDKQNQIINLQKSIQSGATGQSDASTVQLAREQQKVEELTQQLDEKKAESSNLNNLVSQYQQKLEAKNSQYNAQMGQVLSSHHDFDQMQKQIADLTLNLQDREAQIRDLQTKDLSLSVIQERAMDDKITESKNTILQLQAKADVQQQEINNLKMELALARQQLNGSASPDEVEFLRSGLKKATAELRQKEDLLGELQAEVNENKGNSKEQGFDLAQVKQQLQKTYDQLSSVQEDLKYKDMEITRLKEQGVLKTGDLQDQIKDLKKKSNQNEMAALKVQLQNSQSRVDELEGQLDQYTKNETGGSSDTSDLQEQLNNANTRIQQLEAQLQTPNAPSQAAVVVAAPVVEPKERGHEAQKLRAELDRANMQLDQANGQIKLLQDELTMYTKHSKRDALQEKLDQATHEINQQGEVINYLVDKLNKDGQKVDLAPYFSKS